MAAGKHNFLIEQGADFIPTIQFLTPPPDPVGAPETPGPPVDIVGWDARMQVREGPAKAGGTIILDLTLGAGEIAILSPSTDGTFQVLVTAAVTAALLETQFTNGAFYDFEAIDTPGVLGIAGAVYRLLEGRVKFSENVTV
jgi:hypothetical protein